jgi:hypothetical protein
MTAPPDYSTACPPLDCFAVEVLALVPLFYFHATCFAGGTTFRLAMTTSRISIIYYLLSLIYHGGLFFACKKGYSSAVEEEK